MQKVFSKISAILIVALFVVGFAMMSDNHGSRTETSNSTWTPIASETDAAAIYTDNFDANNDTTALKLRGYGVYRRGPGPPGLTAIWFQGNSTVFPAYNGPATGYVAANYNSSTGNNAIDNWLVLPYQAGGYLVGDSLYFWSQAPAASTFPDSLKIMYSVSDSIPEGSWTMIGRMKVNILGIWQRAGFRVPTTSATGRIAIRYGCVDGGPLGNNTDYTGIDALVVERNTTGIHNTGNGVPSVFSLEQNYPNPFNPATRIKFSVPKTGAVKLAVYDAIGSEIEVLFSGDISAGNYMADFDASGLSSGIYFYRLSGEGFSDTKKMILVK